MVHLIWWALGNISPSVWLRNLDSDKVIWEWYISLSILYIVCYSWLVLYEVIRNTNWLRIQLNTKVSNVREAVCMWNHLLSRLIFIWASSIFLNNSASPITRAASLTSRHVSSRRVMHLTIVPSATSVKSVICSKGYIRITIHSTQLRPEAKWGRTYHSFRPFVYNFHQSKLQTSKLFSRHLVGFLYTFYTFRNGDYRVTAFFQFRRESRFDVCLFLEDEAG